MRSTPLGFGLIAFAVLVACGSRDEATSSSAPVVGGYFDQGNGPVVLIFRCTGACAFTPYLNVEELCSGTLVGPNLVLTARHCVAPQLNADNGVLCSQSTFGPTYPADNFVVSPAKDVYEGGPWFFSAQVAVDPSGDAVCGHDIATLSLAKPAIGITPMAPRLVAPPVKGEVYSAVGYGDDLDGGLGYRHRRDGLHVQCVSTACKLLGTDLQPLVGADEFLGETGLCGGDSGGPAIGSDGLLFGVTSRGANCTLPVYERVDAHAAWLQGQAVSAAVTGGYEIPSWAFTALPTDAGTSDGAVADAAPASDASQSPIDSGSLVGGQVAGGCSSSGGSRDIFGFLALAVAWLLRSARTRSKSWA